MRGGFGIDVVWMTERQKKNAAAKEGSIADLGPQRLVLRS
jgi:hypothetical protein